MSNDPKVAQAPAPNAANQSDKSASNEKSGANETAKTDAKPDTPPADAKKI